jgi:hypothetical protein
MTPGWAEVGLGLLAILLAGVLALEVHRRNPRLLPARLVLVGSLAVVLWSALELAAARLEGDPVVYHATFGLSRVLTMLSISLGVHFLRVFPSSLGAGRAYLAGCYAPVAAIAVVRVWVLWQAGYSAEAALRGSDLSSFLETGLKLVMLIAGIASLLGQHRASSHPIERVRVRAMGAGVALSTISGLSAAVPVAFGYPWSPVTAYHSLPILGALTYAIVRYQLFDIEVLKREAWIAVVGGALVGSAALLCVWVVTWFAGAPDIALAAAVAAAGALVFLLQHQVRSLASWLVEGANPGLKWKECRVLEVLLVHESGVLLASHVPGGGRPAVGSVESAGPAEVMVAVQAVLRESLRLPEKETVRSLAVGPLKLVIEHGAHCHLVAVFEGFEHPRLRADLRETLARVETGYGEHLKTWKGDLSKLDRVETILARIGAPVASI